MDDDLEIDDISGYVMCTRLEMVASLCFRGGQGER